MSPILNREPRKLEIYCTVAVAAGFIAVFLIGASGLPGATKLFFAIAVLLLSVGLPIYALLAKHDRIGVSDSESKSVLFDEAVDEELAVLEEAAVFFSASLESNEMLRLLKSRLEAMRPACRFEFFTEDSSGGLSGTSSEDGIKSGKKQFSMLTDLAYKALSSGKTVSAEELRRNSDADASKFRGVAIPLKRGGEVFCILTAYTPHDVELPDQDLLDAVAARVGPLIAGSLSFESSVSNALTDSLTQLPNERAMHLILENQVAEAQRFGKSRQLTLLSVDIDSFDEINHRFGHSEGDGVLVFAGRMLQEQLRKMDYLARTSDDEYFIILPTAESGSSVQVMNRIAGAFEAHPYKYRDGTLRKIKLNFGCATFGKDGDTAAKLIRAAVENKQLNKPSSGGSVLKFPTN